MKGLFSFELYKQGLKRIRVAGLAVTVLAVIAELVNAITTKERLCEICDRDGLRRYIMADDIMFGSFVLLLLAVPLSYVMFSFLNKRQSADFYHAMPHKRTAVYVSFTLALLTWLFGTLVLNCAASAFGYGVLRGFDIDLWLCAKMLLYYCSATLIVCGATLTAVMCTGSAVTAFLTAVLFLLVPIHTVNWFEKLLGGFYSHVDYTSGLFKYLGTQSNVIYKLFDGQASHLAIGISAVKGVLWIAIGGVCYAKRKSERTAISFVSDKALVLVGCMIAFVFALKGVGVYDDSHQIKSCLYIFAGAVAMLVYLLVFTKNAKSTAKSMCWFLAVLALCGGIAGTAYLTGLVMENNTPASVYDIESVTFNKTKMVLKGHEASGDFPVLEIKDEAVISFAFENIKNKLPQGAGTSVTFKLKNGNTVNRRVHVDFSRGVALERYIIENCPETNKLFCALPTVSRFESEEQKELWETFSEEYYSATFGNRDRLKGWGETESTFYVYVINSEGEEEKWAFNAKENLTPKTYRLLHSTER